MWRIPLNNMPEIEKIWRMPQPRSGFSWPCSISRPKGGGSSLFPAKQLSSLFLEEAIPVAVQEDAIVLGEVMMTLSKSDHSSHYDQEVS